MIVACNIAIVFAAVSSDNMVLFAFILDTLPLWFIMKRNSTMCVG